MALLRSSRCLAIGLGVGLSLVSLSASAATWGSFNAARIAYAIGPLTGDNHAGLRALIEAHGDTVASGTAELTAEYLAGVDVFYTSMLSDGTGPTAGQLGTLSPQEAAALQDWVTAGGTLVVTADSNGFEGPWEPVYDSFTQVWGVAGYTFFPGASGGVPTASHAITENVTTYAFDGSTTFVFGIEGAALGTGTDPRDTFIAVFEPATGFEVGGRLLLLGDHNMFTDPFLDSADNATLAANVIAWAAGECGNGIVEGTETCDDGNLDDGDDCDAVCGTGGGTGSGGDTTAGDDSTGDASSSTTSAAGDDTTGSTPSPSDSSTGSSESSIGATTADASDGTGTSPATDDGGEAGCGCRTSTRAGGWVLVFGALVGLRRRGRPTQATPRAASFAVGDTARPSRSPARERSAPRAPLPPRESRAPTR